MYIQEVAVAEDGSAYAAAGADGKAYYFDITAGGALAPRWAYNPPGKSACRWVHISDDGSLVSAVFSFGGGPGAATKGRVYLLGNIKNPGSGKKFDHLWTGSKDTAHGPNAVSMGTTAGSKNHVTVADGIPSILKGGFYLFDGSDGKNLWDSPPDHNFPTTRMDYTVAMAADGSAVAGGSNDGNVYYFDVN
jgi:hypothetical protein